MHPWARACAILLPFLAILVSRSLLVPLAVWVAVVPLLAKHRLLVTHGKFAAVGVAPILVALLVVWTASSSAPPFEPIDWPGPPGPGYALLIAARILAAGALLHAMVLPLVAAGELAATLTAWGVGAKGTQIVVSSIALMEDVKRKAQRVADARAARGLMPKRRWHRLKALPALLRPVFFGSLESAIRRADLWRHRGIDPTSPLQDAGAPTAWRLSDAFVVMTSAAALAVSLALLVA